MATERSKMEAKAKEMKAKLSEGSSASTLEAAKNAATASLEAAAKSAA